MNYSLIHMTQKPYVLTKRQVMQLIDSTAEAPKFSEIFPHLRNKMQTASRKNGRPNMAEMRRIREEARVEIQRKTAFLRKLGEKRHWEWSEGDFPKDERLEWHQVKRKLDKREQEICRAVLASDEEYESLPKFVQLKAEDAAVEAVRKLIDNAQFPHKSISSHNRALVKLLVGAVTFVSLMAWRVGQELLEAVKKDPFFAGLIFAGIPAALILGIPYRLIKSGRRLYGIGIDFENAMLDALDRTIRENEAAVKKRLEKLK